MIDVLVVGAGVAGSSAALKAAEFGANVTILDGGTGASTLAPGVMDHRGADETDDVAGELNIPAFDHLTMTLSTIVTTAGTILPCRGRDRALLDVGPLDGRIAVPRSDHGGWDADLFAKSWNAVLPATATYVPIAASLLRFVDERAMPDADLAARHDDPARLAWLAERLREALAEAGGSFAGVLLPPWLGIEKPRAAELAALVGMPCGEAVGNVGGPSGLRFERARDRAFSAANVKVERGRALRVQSQEDRQQVDPQDVHLDNGIVLRARAVIVATGGLVGGGLSYTPSTSVLGGPMPVASRSTLESTVGGPFVVGFEGKPLRSPGSLFGAAPEDLAWPTAAKPILERAGVLHEMGRVRAAAGNSSKHLYVAGDVADEVYGSWMWAAYSGATAGELAAKSIRSST